MTIEEVKQKLKEAQDKIKAHQDLIIFGSREEIEAEFKRVCQRAEVAEREEYERLKEKYEKP